MANASTGPPMRLSDQQCGAVRGLKLNNQFTILMEAIEAEYQQAMKDLSVSGVDRFQWHQGRAAALKTLIEQITAVK